MSRWLQCMVDSRMGLDPGPVERPCRVIQPAKHHAAEVAVLVMAALVTVTGCTGTLRRPLRPADRVGSPRHHRCLRTLERLEINGKLDERAWRHAPRTATFVDIDGGSTPPPLRTNVRMLWDEQYLYIGGWLEETHVWATLRQRDAVVYHDNDFEVFIDPDGDGEDYFEIEINALGTIFDLFLERSYRDGGPARHEWNINGLKAAVCIEGTLNDPSDIDRHWTVEMAIPWKAMAEYADMPLPPNEGDVWRMNFSRVQWPHTVVHGRYQKVSGQSEENWVWSPQGEIDMHVPSRWGFLVFSGKTVQSLSTSEGTDGTSDASP